MDTKDILELTRRILRYANRGNSRYISLRDISDMLLDFADCDALEIVHRDGDVDYIYSMGRNDPHNTKFKLLSNSSVAGELSDNLNGNIPIQALCKLVLNHLSSVQSPEITANSSLWIDDVHNLSVVIKKSVSINWEENNNNFQPYRSLVFLPIADGSIVSGVLILKAVASNFFTRYEIPFFENMAQTFGLATADRRAQSALRERVKELTCLYGIARIAEQSDLTLQGKLQRIADILPPSWQHPDIAVAKIELDDTICLTDGYRSGCYRQSAQIFVNSVRRGVVEVAYIDDKPELEQIPFLREEVSLIEEVARQIGLIVEKADATSEKNRLQDQLRHADRLATIGKLAAGIAHELNEPLGSILGFSQLAKKELPADKGDQLLNVSQDLDKIERASLHARQIIRNMMIFARQLPTSKSLINMNKVVEETLSFFEMRCGKIGITIDRKLKNPLPKIKADPAQMHQLLVNLIVNAIHAMPKGGLLTIRTDNNRETVHIYVEDTGIGMSQETKEQIFNPFFTTKDVNQGTGLGLSVVHGIVKSHNGTIEVESQIGKGTTFSLQLSINKVQS